MFICSRRKGALFLGLSKLFRSNFILCLYIRIMNTRIKQFFDLTGKVAVVTGASKGIGESMARGLAEFGAKVVVSSRDQAAVDEVATELRADGLEAIGIACHVAKDSDRQKLIDQTIATWGRLDILVNNAGTNPYFGPIEDLTQEAY
jgi:dehydrogenase/reductase SDR family member 4